MSQFTQLPVIVQNFLGFIALGLLFGWLFQIVFKFGFWPVFGIAFCLPGLIVFLNESASFTTIIIVGSMYLSGSINGMLSWLKGKSFWPNFLQGAIPIFGFIILFVNTKIDVSIKTERSSGKTILNI